MKHTCRRDATSPPLTSSPNSSAVPSVGGNRPVSIFMVVVLPQPFEPRNPKISPRSMRKSTWFTATKSPNSGSAGAPRSPADRRTAGRRHHWPLWPRRTPGQQADEGPLDSGFADARALRPACRSPAPVGVHRHQPPEAFGPSMQAVARARSWSSAARGSGRSAPRTAAAPAGRRRWSAHRGSAGQGRDQRAAEPQLGLIPPDSFPRAGAPKGESVPPAGRRSAIRAPPPTTEQASEEVDVPKIESVG